MNTTMNDPVLNGLTDEALVELAKVGDDDAFNTIVNRHINHILNFVRQYAPQKEDAEDIVQNTFFKAWKHIGGFKKDKKFLTWLFTIARNTALDHIKRRHSFSFSEIDKWENAGGENEISFEDSLSDSEPLPSEVYERKEIATELLEVMDILSPDYRATLIMHYQDDMTFEEIALVMKKPMNTVKSWHRRAVTQIRRSLLDKAASHQNR